MEITQAAGCRPSHPAFQRLTMKDFSSNDYLGLCDLPDFHAAIGRVIAEWAGDGVDNLSDPASPAFHAALETTLSDYLGTEATLVYASHFSAVTSVVGALLDDSGVVFVDGGCDAALVDAAKRSGARVLLYRHLDADDVEVALRTTPPESRVLLLTEGVFASDGSTAPLVELAELAERHSALLLVDDTHGLGVTGASGGGTRELHGVVEQVDLVMWAFDKPDNEGCVSGRSRLIDLLRARTGSHPAQFEPLPLTAAASAMAALEYLVRGDEIRAEVRRRSREMRQAITRVGLPVNSGDLPIVTIPVRDVPTARRIVEAMFDKDILITAVHDRRDRARRSDIRLQVSAAHTTEDIRTCVDGLVAAWMDADAASPEDAA